MSLKPWKFSEAVKFNGVFFCCCLMLASIQVVCAGIITNSAKPFNTLRWSSSIYRSSAEKSQSTGLDDSNIPVDQCDWFCHVERLQLQSCELQCLCRMRMKTDIAMVIYHYESIPWNWLNATFLWGLQRPSFSQIVFKLQFSVCCKQSLRYLLAIKALQETQIILKSDYKSIEKVNLNMIPFQFQ